VIENPRVNESLPVNESPQEDEDLRVKRNLRLVRRNPGDVMIKRASFACFMLLLFAMVSCTKGEVYYRFYHVQHGKWYRDSSFLFTVDSAAIQPGESYSLSIELSFNNAYSYQDLWLCVEHNLTDFFPRSDTLYVTVADERGRWLGSGVGGLHQLSIPYLDDVRPTARDVITGYRVKVSHYMDDNPLTGMEKVGLKLVAR